ncbi:hypothetical protein [Bradyrhizobium sp. CCGB12]|nr:hypothetical protein [Bradyrhizobium sp. CCGB12]
MPIQQPVKFDLIINLKTAKILGLISENVLTRAAIGRRRAGS